MQIDYIYSEYFVENMFGDSLCAYTYIYIFLYSHYLQGNFVLQPNGVWASFGSVTRYLPTDNINNLRNLEDVEQVVQDIVSGELTDWDEANEYVYYVAKTMNMYTVANTMSMCTVANTTSMCTIANTTSMYTKANTSSMYTIANTTRMYNISLYCEYLYYSQCYFFFLCVFCSLYFLSKNWNIKPDSISPLMT